ncbi:Uma2 family endonuclease [Hymenobacter coccineus]|uniref:Putative restriction endonuclease domain-containing protein n=1 Tax=Hymenobacter coccineus TaxID=1908235 RepID=A0A1G1SZT6_9BACT|nr:Uma2 family endonuclease [Hymenobacter coccineus]OGX84140.1 hypothetical protein BEN49_11510 [Hymenobacter coccineus]
METLAIELSEYELERGKPMPSRNHGIIQANLVLELGTRYRQQYRFISEVNIDVIGRVMVPDVGIFTKMLVDMQHDEIVLAQLPLTTIEILSPAQALTDLVDKAASYFDAGVKSCWIVLPQLQAVVVYANPTDYTFFHGAQTLTDPATGIELPLGPLFE